MENVLKLYKSLARIPSLNSAKITWMKESTLVVQSNWSQRNLERSANQKFTVDYNLSSDLNVISENFPIDVTSEYVANLQSA